MSVNKRTRERLLYAAQVGIADPVIKYGGRHQRLVGTAHGKPIVVFVSCTPSDRLAERNFKARVRRALRAAQARAFVEDRR